MEIYITDNLEIPYQTTTITHYKQFPGKTTTTHSVRLLVYYDRIKQNKKKVKPLRKISTSQLRQLGYQHETIIDLEQEEQEARHSEIEHKIHFTLQELVAKFKRDKLI